MTDRTLVDSLPQISEEQVAEYLRKHPDFFVSKPDLLADLSLPHQSGQAISLIERQVSILRERNIDMRHRLSKLLDTARDNDKLFDKTKRLVLALLEAKDLNNMVSTLFHSFSKDFQIHHTTLLLFGNAADLRAGQARVISLDEARPHIGNLLRSSRALCGTFSNQETAYLFGDNAKNVGSAALVPLVYGTSFGLLAIGNSDPQYYRSSMGTLFLGYIAEVLNRTLPPLLPR